MTAEARANVRRCRPQGLPALDDDALDGFVEAETLVDVGRRGRLTLDVNLQVDVGGVAAVGHALELFGAEVLEVGDGAPKALNGLAVPRKQFLEFPLEVLGVQYEGCPVGALVGLGFAHQWLSV